MLGENVLSFGSYRFRVQQRMLTQGERRVRIGSRAREILAALLERAGEVVPKGVLMKRVWADVFVGDGTLRVHVASLRKILGRDRSGERYIETVTGLGYRFAAPVTPICGFEQIAGSDESDRSRPCQDWLPQIAYYLRRTHEMPSAADHPVQIHFTCSRSVRFQPADRAVKVGDRLVIEKLVVTGADTPSPISE